MTNDNEEPSAASAGYVVAWAVADGTTTLVGYHSCSRDKAEAWARHYGFPNVVPLYRSPTLTDAERAAVAWMATALAGQIPAPMMPAIVSVLEKVK